MTSEFYYKYKNLFSEDNDDSFTAKISNKRKNLLGEYKDLFGKSKAELPQITNFDFKYSMNPGKSLVSGSAANSSKLRTAGLSMIKPPSITTFKNVPKIHGLHALPPPNYDGLNRNFDFAPQ